MNKDEEIRARALEIAAGAIAAMPPEWTAKHVLKGEIKSLEELVIITSVEFEKYIKAAPQLPAV